jgi:hypothetical protein
MTDESLSRLEAEATLTFDAENLCHRWPDGSVFEGYPCTDCERPVHDWAAGDNEWDTVMVGNEWVENNIGATTEPARF